jgi:hypothetical protein
VHRLLAEQHQDGRADITAWRPAAAWATPRTTAGAALTAAETAFPLTTVTAETAFAGPETALSAASVHRHSFFAHPRSTAAGVTMTASAASEFVWGVHNILLDSIDECNDISLVSLTQGLWKNFPLPLGQGVHFSA